MANSFNLVIYNIGLPRTGTKHISLELKKRGIKFKHPQLSKGYDFNIDNIKKDTQYWKIDNHIYSDTPIWHPIFWDIINVEEHKIIHTLRDSDSWIRSMINNEHLFILPNGQYRNRDDYWFSTYFTKNSTTKHTGFDRELLKDVYHKHLEDVDNYFGNNLISINITEDNIDQKLNEVLT